MTYSKSPTLKDRLKFIPLTSLELLKLENSPNNRQVVCAPDLLHCLKTQGWELGEHVKISIHEEGKKLVEDGWQRVQGAIEAGIPLIYAQVVDPSFTNNGRPGNYFSGKDTLSVYLRRSTSAYVDLNMLKGLTTKSVSIFALACLMEGKLVVSEAIKKNFHAGRFHPNAKAKRFTRDLLIHIHRLEIVGLDWVNDENFVSALAICCRIPQFDLKVAVAQFDKYCNTCRKVHDTMLAARRRLLDYLRLINEVYNWNLKSGKISNLYYQAVDIKETQK